MSTIQQPASRRQRTAQPVRPDVPMTTTSRPRSTAVKISFQLINEALSRARMRQPQDVSSEAYRPARQITISVRRQQTRMLGQ
jgi:hypothetical protein